MSQSPESNSTAGTRTQSQGESFTRRVTTGVISGIISGLVTGLCLWVLATYLSTRYSNSIDDYLTRLHPTCTNPGDLHQVPTENITAAGGGTGAAGVLDGYFGSIWLPSTRRDPGSPHVPTYADAPQHRSLILTLPSRADVRLVCVNNGLGNSESNYQNWGRVRTVIVSAAPDERGRTAVLRSLPVTELQQMQEAARDLGNTDTVVIRVVDAYGGMSVEDFDPDHCGQDSERLLLADGETAQSRYLAGCIRAPVPRAGLSEVVLYAR